MNGKPKSNTEEIQKIACEQNYETFRSLNQQMWQIPIISMTLTGGLWFGVSGASDFPVFQVALLVLAFVGNLALAVIIVRLRYVMDKHLDWLHLNLGKDFVEAKGTQWYNQQFVVRTAFQVVLLLAAAVSVVLLIFTVKQTDWGKEFAKMTDNPALAYYQDHAVRLADQYEVVDPVEAHPELNEYLAALPEGTQLRVLDVGAGSGRDAAWLSQLGHDVTAVEPSSAMRQLAQHLHPEMAIRWLPDKLPRLAQIGSDSFDLIVLSAVWMHVDPEDQAAALQRLSDLLAANGRIYVTLRLGPAEPDRGILSVSLEGLRLVAEPLGLDVQVLGEQDDLLGRSSVKWVLVMLSAA